MFLLLPWVFCFVSVFIITSDSGSSQVWLLNPHFQKQKPLPFLIQAWNNLTNSLIQTAANHSNLNIYRGINGINQAQKVRTFVLGWAFLCCNNALWHWILPCLKACLFLLKWSLSFKENTFVGCSYRAEYVGYGHENSLLCQSTYFAVNSCLVLLLEVWRNLTTHYFNQQESRLHVAEPYTATTPPAWSHTCGMASYSSTSISHKWVGLVVLVTLARTAHPRWAHKC